MSGRVSVAPTATTRPCGQRIEMTHMVRPPAINARTEARASRSKSSEEAVAISAGGDPEPLPADASGGPLAWSAVWLSGYASQSRCPLFAPSGSRARAGAGAASAAATTTHAAAKAIRALQVPS